MIYHRLEYFLRILFISLLIIHIPLASSFATLKFEVWLLDSANVVDTQEFAKC